MQVHLIALKTFTGHNIFLLLPGDTINGLEKIIRFGNQYQAQLSSSTNTLFGDLQMTEVWRRQYRRM